MSKDNFFRKIIRRLSVGKRNTPTESNGNRDSAIMGRLLQMVDNTDEVEIPCDEVFDLLDLYVECEARGEDVTELLPLVKRHLDKCQDCHEEYEALTRIIEASSDTSA